MPLSQKPAPPQTHDGRLFRTLNIIDEFTKEALVIRVNRRLNSTDEVLLFIVDILNEEATLLVPNDFVKTVAEKSFNATVSSDTVVLPGIFAVEVV